MTKLQQNVLVLRAVRCSPGMTTDMVSEKVGFTLQTTHRRLIELDRSGLIQFVACEYGWYPIQEAETDGA